MIIQAPACPYLFQEYASEIYIAYKKEKITEAQVNESLDTLIKVNVAFLSRKENDGFPFIDPIAFNHQCHLYAFLAGRIKASYKSKTEEEKLAQNGENRFLHLSFLLSYTFLIDRNLLCQTIETAANKGEVTLPKDKALFYKFIKSSQCFGTLTRAARLSLNGVFKQSIQTLLDASQEKNPLYKELYQLSLEDLQLPTGRNQLDLYTLPKLAGVALLIEEKVAYVIKTKIISSQGTTTHLLYHKIPQEENRDAPVLVFEAVTSEDSIQSFVNMAKQCSSYFERNPSAGKRHPHNEHCLFCQPQQIDMERYRERFTQSTTSIEETLYALGTDFVQEIQKPFIPFFENKEKYPLLHDIFKRAIHHIDLLGLSMQKPTTFTIDHVYLDNVEHALSSEFRMTSSPETYLHMRGFL